MGPLRWTFPGKKPGAWPHSRGLQGPLPAVWDSSLRSWCLKKIRQRPPCPGHLALAQHGLRLARTLPRWLVPRGEACAERARAGVGQEQGGPGPRHEERKAGTLQSPFLLGLHSGDRPRATEPEAQST